MSDKPEIYSCSGGCGRQVAEPAMLKNGSIKGNVRILCKKCSKRESYYNSKVRTKP